MNACYSRMRRNVDVKSKHSLQLLRSSLAAVCVVSSILSSPFLFPFSDVTVYTTQEVYYNRCYQYRQRVYTLGRQRAVVRWLFSAATLQAIGSGPESECIIMATQSPLCFLALCIHNCIVALLALVNKHLFRDCCTLSVSTISDSIPVSFCSSAATLLALLGSKPQDIRLAIISNSSSLIQSSSRWRSSTARFPIVQITSPGRAT